MAVIAVLGAASALASTTSRAAGASRAAAAPTMAPTRSTSGFAGYSSGRYYATFRLSATFRVPSLSCSGKTDQSTVAGITVNDSVGSYFYVVGLVMRCVNGGGSLYPEMDDASSFPQGDPQDRAQPGDRIELEMSLTKAKDALWVVDRTHFFKVGSPGGTRGVAARWGGLVGEFPWQSGMYSQTQPVPDFGRLHFSKVMLNGSPISSVKGIVRDQWTGKIATSAIGNDHESFTTSFQHS